MSELTYRPASPGDLATLRRWDESPHVKAANPNDVWDWEGEFSGRPPWRELWIGEPDLLGRGHGTEMMRFAIERCFSIAEVHSILVDPLADNHRARRFYERLGFEFLERRRFGEDNCRVYILQREKIRGQKNA